MLNLPQNGKAVLQNKTIHRNLVRHLHAIFIPAAPGRLPRGTSGSLLNAAWFPTWHGSQFPIAQDPPLNTAEYDSTRKESTLKIGIHPCCSGFQVQGSAASPAGMALFNSTALFINTFEYFIYYNRKTPLFQ